jgi:O-antigen/teichoic acid export membrane protein
MSSKLNKAIINTLVGRFSVYIVQLILLMSYARIFTPNEFGLVASIVIVVVFFQLLSDIGIGPALINEKHVSSSDISGAFTFTLVLGLLFSIFLYILSPKVAYYYQNDIFEVLIVLVIPSVLFSCLSIVPYTCVVKSLKFKTIAIIEVIAHLASFLLIILLLEKYENVYLLAIKSSFYSAIRFLLLYILSRTTTWGQPHLTTNFTIIYRIKKFASYQFGFGIINYFSRNTDNILIAKNLGSESLGVYDQAYQLMKYPIQLTSFALGSAIQPILSEHKNDLKYIENEHNKLTQKLIALSVIIALGIHYNSKLIVDTLLGNNWGLVIPIIEIFNYSIPVQMISATCGGFFQSISRADLLFQAGVRGALIFISCIGFSIIIFKDVNSVAFAVSISFYLNYISIYYLLFRKGFKGSIRGFLKVQLFVLFKVLPYILITIFIYELPIGLNHPLLKGVVTTLIPLFICHRVFINIFKEKYKV